MLGVEQQIIFGEKSREQHAMPVLVGNRLLQVGNGLRSALRIAHIAQLSSVCAQLVPQGALIGCQGGVRFMAVDGEALEGLLCAFFRNPTCAILTSDSFLELAAEISGKSCHGY